MAARITAKSSLPPRTTPLAQLRLEQGLTREQLASLAGLAARTIYAIEREGVQPQRATSRVLAEALGCDPGELTNDERPPDQAGIVEESRGAAGHGEA